MAEILPMLRIEQFQMSGSQMFALDNFGQLHMLTPDGNAWYRLPALTVQFVPPIKVAPPEAQ